MNCKNCGRQLPEEELLCPDCGTDNSVLPEAEEVEIAPAENLEAAEAPAAEEEVAASPAVSKMKRMAVISGGVAVLAVLALLLFAAMGGGKGQGADKKIDVASWFDWEIFRKNDVMKQDDYSVSHKTAQRKADTVVATMGDAKLTNGLLQFFYQRSINTFLNENSGYISSLGLDMNIPLSQQICYVLGDYTWQQYFVQSAIEDWKTSQATALQAIANGYQLDSKYQQRLETLEADLAAEAVMSGYADAEAYVDARCGANCSVEDYIAYIEMTYYGSQYFIENLKPLDEAELQAYYDANKETLNAAGIVDDGSYCIDVRHILVRIDNIAKENPDETGVKGEDGYTEAQWAACEAAAQAILDRWLENPTEENFAALANELSQDKNGNVTDGGIYPDVIEGMMVEAFNDWCFDESRQVGDYGLVKTPYGYHVMFFSAYGPELWLERTQSFYQQNQMNMLMETAMNAHEVEINYSKIALTEVGFGS